jgi:SpoVK/Ycf46/Vps4 family AAA+-type ATPase
MTWSVQALITEQEAKDALRAALAGRRSLIVLDDVWNVEHADAFAITKPPACLLIATPNPEMLVAFGAAEHLAVFSKDSPILMRFSTELPHYASWSDLVLPIAQMHQLRDICDYVMNESYLAKEWNVTRSNAKSGTQVFFHGEHGTGKSLAASVLAYELGLDLYKMDYQAVLSHHAIDTAQNLEQLFDAVDTLPVILLIDDAEILFGTQSGISNLLGMVALRGNLIFTTTKTSEIDKRLLSLVSHIVEFPFPDDELRERIWQVSMPFTLPRSDNINYTILAERFKLSGEEIRKAIYAAASVAKREGRAVTMKHLESAAEGQSSRRLI